MTRLRDLLLLPAIWRGIVEEERQRRVDQVDHPGTATRAEMIADLVRTMHSIPGPASTARLGAQVRGGVRPVAPVSLDARPATWRGMTGMDPDQPVATLGFMLFDGTMIDLVLSDRDLERMVRQVVETVPQGWARPHVSLFHPESASGRLAEAGSMPRSVGLQSPDSSLCSTSSGERA